MDAQASLVNRIVTEDLEGMVGNVSWEEDEKHVLAAMHAEGSIEEPS